MTQLKAIHVDPPAELIEEKGLKKLTYGQSRRVLGLTRAQRREAARKAGKAKRKLKVI